MELSSEIRTALDRAWNREVAGNSIERWLRLCEAENWGRIPENMDLLVRIFGASWYFTRFIFVNGRDMVDLVDGETPDDFGTERLVDAFAEAAGAEGLENRLEKLRILKNRTMLQILIANLQQQFDQEQTEVALTCLAEATVRVIAQLFELTPGQTETPVTVLGMGRMAGYEMTFGSDLDLIFLYRGQSGDLDVEIEHRIRMLLRHIATQTPMGSLYDVDMRLRPHGNAGILVATFHSFIDYHSEDRDVWERQMMTRCRPVTENDEATRSLMVEINRHIYDRHDAERVRTGVASMRRRVEKELGRPAGKYEVKRGRGGIMDIDFITHYFQLVHGHDNPDLRTASTRAALRFIKGAGMLDGADCDRLLESYDVLKQVEMSLRLFDMKPISTFPFDDEANPVLARAMGFANEGSAAFVEYYRSVTDSVRSVFKKVIGDP